MAFSGKNRSLAVAALACWLTGVAFAGLTAGCIGAGDDTVTPTPPADGGDGGDAHAADGATDGPGEAHAADAAGEGATGDAAAEGGSGGAAEAGGEAGSPSARFSATAVDFGSVACGATPATNKTLTVTNAGTAPLVVTASLLGSAFALSPSNFTLQPGGSNGMTLSALVPSAAVAGTAITGSLAVFTNDPSNANHVFPLSVTPTGASLDVETPLYVFPSTEVGTSAPPVVVTLKNAGNAAGTFSIGAPNDPSVTLNPPPGDGGVQIPAGGTWTATATFAPTAAKSVAATSALAAVSGTCGAGPASLSFDGTGVTGSVSGWKTVDFGPAPCGGAAPAPQTLTLTNAQAAADVRVLQVDSSGLNGFTTDLTMGARIPSGGGQLDVHFTAPAVPASASLAPITGALVVHTDADMSAQGTTVQLTEEPQGAALAFGDPNNNCAPFGPSSMFGQFPNVILLQSAPAEGFCVTNAGNAPANVTLTAAENGADAGAEAGSGDDGGEAGADATLVDAGSDATVDGGGVVPPPFTLQASAFTLPAANSPTTPTQQQDSITFQPVHANATVGSLAMAVSQTAVCGALPQPLPLSGRATGGGPVVSPTTVTLGATCGGDAPTPQAFVIANGGTESFNWSMSAVTGPGASQYTLTMPTSQTLIPGGSVSIQVSALKVPAPTTSTPTPTAAELQGQVTITTDVPFDPPHVVTLSEMPLGDQLSVSVGAAGPMRFGQVPLNQSISQTFTVTNNANPGSPDAKVSFTPTPGFDGGVSPYTFPPSATVSAGTSAQQTVTFDATAAGSYPTSLAITTTDPICALLPEPLTITGTGTGGVLSLSATTVSFGTDPKDPNGYVNCGATGPAQTVSLSNSGTQAMNIIGLTLGKGTSSPFTLSASASAASPIPLAITASTSVTITPAAIPAAVANPNDATAYADVLTVMTDAPGDTGHTVNLVMQPFGVIIVPGNPLPATWPFGTISAGSIGTFTSSIQNTGNAPATVSLNNLAFSQIFGLENNPTTAAPNAITPLVGQFTPPSENGTWNDQGQLVVTAASAFCQPLPPVWTTPTVTLSGSSNSNPPVTVSGSAVFPTTECGSGMTPAGQPIIITNETNQALTYTVALGIGTFYTLTDSGMGRLAASGTSTVVVSPKLVTPGPLVKPGAAPYADQLLIDVVTSPGADAGTDGGADAASGAGIAAFTVPISWTLNGAVFTLPEGAGPNAGGFYAADSTSGFTLPISNTGTATASVIFQVSQGSPFTVQPSPLQVAAGVQAAQLASTSGAPSCQSGTPAVGTVTFAYTGPVCSPISVSASGGGADAGAQAFVNVHSCAGTFP